MPIQLWSSFSATASLVIGAQKEGQPLPLSYFVSEEKRGWPQQMQLYVPLVLVSQ